MLNLDARDARLNGDFSGKTKEKDGEKVRTLTFTLERVGLDERELCAFFREPHAWNSLYNRKGEQVEPFLRFIKAIEIADTIEGASVTVIVGLDRTEIRFTDCKLSSIKVTLCDGGKTLLSCKVTTAPFLEQIPELFEHFDGDVEAELCFEQPGAQQELPAMNTFGEGEQPEQGSGKRSRRRRNPRSLN